MKILLVEDDPKSSNIIRPLLEKSFDVKIEEVYSIQSAIELLENNTASSNLIICDYHGTSTSLTKCLLALTKNIPCILLLDDVTKVNELLVPGISLPKPVDRNILSKDLVLRITELKGKGLLNDQPATTEPKIDAPTQKVLNEQQENLDKLIAKPNATATESRAAAESSMAVIQDLSGKMGFTPQIQTLAVKSVELTLKLIGSKPRLAMITQSLKKQEGKYISSHSIMLAEICCAIACRVGWNSAPTFFKLTLAAYLHDMVLKDNDLAQCKNLDEVKKRFPNELATFKLHPGRAAEFVLKFNEMPPDVDTIILQHHERPDGTGFPRGLFPTQLSPLSCLFIIAEDMLHYFLDHENKSTIAQFVKERGEQYQSGTFKKILKALGD